MKKVAVFSIIALCILLMYLYPHSMLNPGELVEGHQELNYKCLSCHTPFGGVPNDKCISCHKLSEIGKETNAQTAPNKEKILFHQKLSDQECTSCHTDHQGIKPEHSLTHFNHEILNATEIRKCQSCHASPSGPIHKQITSSCNNCHNTKGWKLAVKFNHDMIILGAKNNCASCHENPGDSFHQQVKDNCNKCHTTDKWKPSTFDHSNYFQLDENHNVKCNTCHSNSNFNAYTCYGCHEHSERNIQQEHQEEGIYNFTNCVSCHKSSNEHDIIVNGNANQKLNQKDLKKVKEYIKSQEREEHPKKDED